MLEAIGGYRGRAVVWLLFFASILAAWWTMFTMAGMAGLNPVGMRAGPGTMPAAGYTALFLMWAIMMLAMMGPTFVPTLSVYEALIASANATRGGWFGLIAGYFLSWTSFASLIAGAQTGLHRLGIVDGMGTATGTWVAALLLVAVGAYQFTPVKQVCQGVCLAPMTYFLGHWRPGFRGGIRMGAGLGAYCVACCWGFMALGFVGGTMNLLWMGLATVLMILEKLPAVASLVTRPLGAVLILAGAAVAGGFF